MSLVSMKELLVEVEKRNLVAPAFNTTNLELTLGIMEGVKQTGYPVIVQVAPTNLKLSGFAYISEIVKLAAASVDVPVTLHLDHGMSMDDIKEAVRFGFPSVMVDGSQLSFEENISLTKEAVDYCHDYGVSVEAELGAIGGKEDDVSHDDDVRTNPKLVKEFVQRTGCHLLAVSVGNVHGLDQKPQIDFNLLREIHAEIDIPLVIHGGSGIPDDVLGKLKDYGVRKVNLASDLRRKYIETIGKRYVKNNDEYNLVSVLKEAKGQVTEVVIQKLYALNGSEINIR
ncbi:class II aldolase [Paenibacillus alkaliterrae]|uniref:class II aldolase n=1 Tax=Paenibacillus alkaliterrae TaxID=320909 RepID=UPI001F1637B3|nr:class II aldolase [Paenibacillus alkaliterrae]MCF2941625.1 class II aldolase [Paenibacillus alkaliterrae]